MLLLIGCDQTAHGGSVSAGRELERPGGWLAAAMYAEAPGERRFFSAATTATVGSTNDLGLVFFDRLRDVSALTAADNLQTRADLAWAKAGLERVTLHDCRHTFASLAIASSVNKALSTYMGHATVAFTLDRYGHLMPGNEADAAELLDTYLASGAG